MISKQNVVLGSPTLTVEYVESGEGIRKPEILPPTKERGLQF
jgi:hypothetical protein